MRIKICLVCLFEFVLGIICVNAQSASVVYDVSRNVTLSVGGSENLQENEVQSSLNETIQMVMSKVQEVSEDIQEVINTASSYVQTAEDIYSAALIVKQTAEMYGNFCDDIKQCTWLTPTEQVRAINQMTSEVNNISKRLLSMQQISGMTSAGLSTSQRHGVEGRMNDGERLKFIHNWLGNMKASMYSLQSIYRIFMTKNTYRSYDNYLTEEFASALFFNY